MSENETKPCPECTKEIPKKAKKCPECQADLRNWFVRHWILSIILVLIIFAIIGSVGQKEEDLKNKEAAQEITAAQLFSEYENEANGNMKFKNRFVKLSGKVQEVRGNLSDTSAIITIDTPDSYDFSPIWCNVDARDESSNLNAGKLTKGDSVVVIGKVAGITMKSIQLSDCEVK